ncbi:5'-nucleotidase [Streptococcus agalactiae]|nr:5'-nucleotidase [Streptococcus agalactiae]PWO03354.1 5'-nucleotidase [Streptococcus agalactiae]PWO03703.1 5'-nucleotidase [Streptococcus agalactiae]QAY22013.1 5'-nucleotidase [Streptococcus agalactiae]
MLPKSLNASLFGFCELRYCVHNIPKIISPADQNLTVLTANDKITWWLRPQTPSEKSWIDFLRNDIRIIKMIWKRYHKIKTYRKIYNVNM